MVSDEHLTVRFQPFSSSSFARVPRDDHNHPGIRRITHTSGEGNSKEAKAASPAPPEEYTITEDIRQPQPKTAPPPKPQRTTYRCPSDN